MKNGKVRAVLVAVLALVLAGGSGVGTFALWNATASAPAGQIQSGNLDLVTVAGGQLDGGVQWGVAVCPPDGDPSTLAYANISNTTWRVWAGETVQMVQPVSYVLEGDNMSAQVEISWQSPPSLGGGSTGTYGAYVDGQPVTLTLTDGSTATRVPLGTTARFGGDTLRQLLPAGGTFELRFWVEVPVNYPMVSTIGGGENLGIGQVKVDLNQVRTGPGFPNANP